MQFCFPLAGAVVGIFAVAAAFLRCRSAGSGARPGGYLCAGPHGGPGGQPCPGGPRRRGGCL